MVTRSASHGYQPVMVTMVTRSARVMATMVTRSASHGYQIRGIMVTMVTRSAVVMATMVTKITRSHGYHL